MAGDNLAIPPDPSEIEVSIFGPGFGECIVVHLGEGAWIVVDSCVDSQSGKPAALNYFARIGVEATTNVRRVVATHWHDDHVRGIGQVFEACGAAEFVCSTGLQTREVATLVQTYSTYLPTGGTGVDELARIMRELLRRSSRSAIAAPTFAHEGSVIYEDIGRVSTRITAFAPSSAALALMYSRLIHDLLPREKRRRRRVPNLGPNDGAVVLSIQVGPTAVLLGADLEERGQSGLGWQVIVDKNLASGLRFDGFKLPHHGSKTGHHSEVWPRMMNVNAWAALTPFTRLGEKLPTDADCVRILADSDQSYVTAPTQQSRFRHPDPAVQRTIGEATLSIAQEPGRQGQIRMRRSLTGASNGWRVELFGSAMPPHQMATRQA